MGSEHDFEEPIDYDEAHVKQATVLARADIVLLVSLLDSANRQLSAIKVGLICVLMLLIIIAGELANWSLF